MNDMLRINDLGFTYHGYGKKHVQPVLQHLNLHVPFGSKMLILGPPDGGKSTLGRIICALTPKYFAGTREGECWIGDREIGSLEPWELVSQCTLVAQDPQEQLLMTTCADEVAFPLENLGISRERMQKTVRASLEAWGLAELAQANPQELSGGERKRLLLAVLDAINSPLWVLDESFDDLDTYWRGNLMDALRRHSGSVIVFASRYLKEFQKSFDSYGMLVEGSVTFGSEEEVVAAYGHEFTRPICCTQTKGEAEHSHELECHEVTIVHPRRSVASSEPFTLSVPEFFLSSGKIVALVGPNGSGKSTLSRVLCGLDGAVTGKFLLDGKAVSSRQLLRSVGYLFQNPDYGIFLPTVRDELLWSLRHEKYLSNAQREERIATCASLFHLDPDDNPATMSWGARKRLQAALYYLLDRPFYIIDEIDSGVTYESAFEIVSLLAKNGAGIVLITHDRFFVQTLADCQYSIIGGTVVPAEVGA